VDNRRYTVPEAAWRLGMSESGVRERVASGRLHGGTEPGGGSWVDADQVDAERAELLARLRAADLTVGSPTSDAISELRLQIETLKSMNASLRLAGRSNLEAQMALYDGLREHDTEPMPRE
jgi:hypothetical protein